MKKDGEVSVRFRTFIRQYYDFVATHAAQAALVTALIVGLELFVLADKFLLWSVLDHAVSYSAGTLAQEVFERFTLLLVALFVLILLAKAALRALVGYVSDRIAAAVATRFRRQLFTYVLAPSLDEHGDVHTDLIAEQLQTKRNAVETLAHIGMQHILPFSVQFFLVALTLLFFGLGATLIIMCTVCVLIIASFALALHLQNTQTASTQRKARTFSQDVVSHRDSLAYLGEDKVLVERFGAYAQHGSEAALRRKQAASWLQFLNQVLLSVGVMCALYLPVRAFLNHTLSIGALAFIFALYFSLARVGQGTIAHVGALYKASKEFSITTHALTTATHTADSGHREPLTVAEGSITFEHVSASVQGKKLITDFSLTIAPQEKVAIVGPSGSGKSTIVRLLFRVIEASGGTIRIDGTDIRTISRESLHAELSIVPQECVLFADTLYTNIAFANRFATQWQVERAIKAAQLEPLVHKLPRGLDTVLDEKGAHLSGGEKQRISVARALLADRRIIVLDEPTAALDAQTEEQLQQDISRAIADKTAIIIAHRLSTIVNADKIVVLKKGKIVQQGTHRQLLQRKGLYRTLWQTQRKGYTSR